MGCTLFSQ